MKAPSLYISHGSPLLLLERNQYHEDLKKYVSSIDKPDAILVLSAHWQDNLPIQISSFQNNPMIYDFYGFPEELYKFEYHSPGAPELSNKIKNLLDNVNINANVNNSRGLDHGTWVPLSIMYPQADIPIVQVSIPTPRKSTDLMKMGEVLSALRSENIMLMGSGSLVHNLRLAMQNLQVHGTASIPEEDWAVEFDEWIISQLEDNIENIYNADSLAPNFSKAHPTTEHFDPIHFTLGAIELSDGIKQVHGSMQAGNLSMRCFGTE